MSYIGSTPTTQSFISGTDYFNGTGSQTAFTLTRTVNSVNDIEAVVNNVVQQPNSAYTLSGTTITFTSAPSAGTNNIYVRYLSTTTQSITPAQNTVSYSTLNTDMQSGGYASNFRNRIINGAMMIDQRNAGASVTGDNGVFGVDRFQTLASVSSKLTVQQNAGSVTPPAGFSSYLGYTSSSSYSVGAGEVFIVRQKIEGLNVADFAFGTANATAITLSFWVRSSLTGTFSGTIKNSGATRAYVFSYTISSANTWEQKSVTIAGDTSGTWLTTNGLGLEVAFTMAAGSSMTGSAGSWGSDKYGVTGTTSLVGTNGATFYITGVQLEKGSTATSFDYRPFGTELALCQRYFMSYLGGSTYARVGQGYGISSTAVSIMVQNPVTMRANPTYSFSGAIRIWDGAAGADVTSFSVDHPDTTVSTFVANVASGVTVSRYYQLISWGNTTARVTSSAEL